MNWREIDDDALTAACLPRPEGLAFRDFDPDDMVVIRYSDAPPEVARVRDVRGMPRIYGYVTNAAREIVAARQEAFRDTFR